MILATRVESASTLGALTPALHVLINRQHMFTIPTQHSSFISAVARPCPGCVIFARIMATNAGVDFVATKMLDGDDVEGRVPVRTLRALCYRQTVDHRCMRAGCVDVGHVVRSDATNVGRWMHDDVEMGLP